jgi:hypothetical protein
VLVPQIVVLEVAVPGHDAQLGLHSSERAGAAGQGPMPNATSRSCGSSNGRGGAGSLAWGQAGRWWPLQRCVELGVCLGGEVRGAGGLGCPGR